jgi:hypothetical protein
MEFPGTLFASPYLANDPIDRPVFILIPPQSTANLMPFDNRYRQSNN